MQRMLFAILHTTALLVDAVRFGPNLQHTPSRPAVRAVTAVASVAAVEVEERSGYCVLRPQGEPRGLLHFCGGVFVSPAPQVAYRYLLESRARRGVAVGATQYAVDFDYSKP